MWKTTTTKHRLVIAAIALTGLGLVAARLVFVDPAQAKQAVVLVQKGPVTAKMGDRARLGVMNDGNKTVGVQLVFRSADDFGVLPMGASDMMPVPPGTSKFFAIDLDLGESRFRAGVIVVSAGPPKVSPSLQVFETFVEPTGRSSAQRFSPMVSNRETSARGPWLCSHGSAENRRRRNRFG